MVKEMACLSVMLLAFASPPQSNASDFFRFDCQEFSEQPTGGIHVRGINSDLINIQIGQSPNFSKLGDFTEYGDPANWTQAQFRRGSCKIDTSNGQLELSCFAPASELPLLNGFETTGLADVTNLRIEITSAPDKYISTLSFLAKEKVFNESIEFKSNVCTHSAM